jgi:membrane-associated protein
MSFQLISALFDFVSNLDQHLIALAQEYGNWIYGLLFLIIFSETGLVVTPWLPGDSLLFVAGAVAASGSLDVSWLVASLVAAAFLGNLTNFKIGEFLGPRVFRSEDSWFFKRKYLEDTHSFYERHGGKTIIISRFLPLFRTYAPFVAGMAQMPNSRFMAYNLIGALLWVLLLVYGGYWFGNLVGVKQNLTLIILGIIFVSLLPGAFAYLRTRPRSP